MLKRFLQIEKKCEQVKRRENGLFICIFPEPSFLSYFIWHAQEKLTERLCCSAYLLTLHVLIERYNVYEKRVMVKVLVISISIIQMLAIQLNLEVQFENLFDQLSRLVPSSEPNVEQFKTALVNSCYQCPNHEAKFSQFIATEQNGALRDLSYNKQILISRPDKESGIEGQQQQ